MGKKITLADIGKLLKGDKTKGDTSYWGVVQSVNTTGGEVTSYNVSLGGDTGTVKCRKLAGAKVNDTVLVTLRSTGEAVVVGTKNGDTDASDAQTTADTAQETASTAQQTANSASATATNAYNKAAAVENHFWFEGTGSDVGVHISTDTTIGSTTLNTLINAGGMAVRKGTTIISQFTDTLIELGKNTTSAIIQFCGGAGKLSYSSGVVSLSRNATGATASVSCTTTSAYLYARGDGDCDMGVDSTDNEAWIEADSISLGGNVKLDSRLMDSSGYNLINCSDTSGLCKVGNKRDKLYLYGIDTITSTSGTNALRINGNKVVQYSSSREVKENIKPIEIYDSNDFYKLKPSQFNYKEGSDDDVFVGFISEEINEIYPGIASPNDEGKFGMWDEFQMIAMMTKVIQEQHTEIESLKQRVTELEVK